MKKKFILKIIIDLSVVSLIDRIKTKKNNNVSAQSIEWNGVTEVDYFDALQSDAELIQVNGKSMLIDAITNETKYKLIQMIKDEEIKKLDYIIGTHPHEEHIGGLDKAINNFEVREIIMPSVEHRTKIFESVVECASKKRKFKKQNQELR